MRALPGGPAAAGAAVGQGEAVQLGLHRPDRAGGAGGRLQAQAGLCLALVRHDVHVAWRLQGLPAVQLRVGPRRQAGNAQGLLDTPAQRQQARGQPERGGVEVAPPVVVAHACGDDLVAGRLGHAVQARQAARVAAVQRGPCLAGERVARQALDGPLAGPGRFEVADLDIEPRAAAGAQARRQGQVMLGRDVPVVRHAHLEAALAAEAQLGGQPARLALVGHREAQHRQREHGHPQEAQARVARHRLVGLQVHAQIAGRQQPVRVGRSVARAAGVVGRRRAQAGAALEVDALGAAAGLAARELVARLVEVPLEGLHLHLGGRAAVDVALLRDDHPALGARALAGAVVAQAVGADRQAAASQLDAAFGPGLPPGRARDRVGLDAHRQVPILRPGRADADRGDDPGQAPEGLPGRASRACEGDGREWHVRRGWGAGRGARSVLGGGS